MKNSFAIFFLITVHDYQSILVARDLHKFHLIPKNITISRLNENPPIYFLDNFITDEEGTKLKELAGPKFQRSKVGDSEVSEGRTSSTAFLDQHEDEVVKNIANRASSMVGQSAECVEFQIVRYEKDQKYDPHYDYFSKELLEKKKSQRIMTFFVYLNDLEEDAGGQTVFPKLDLSVTPKKNAAVFWRNIDENNEKDERTLHGGDPVKRGEKWAINIWIHDRKPG